MLHLQIRSSILYTSFCKRRQPLHLPITRADRSAARRSADATSGRQEPHPIKSGPSIEARLCKQPSRIPSTIPAELRRLHAVAHLPLSPGCAPRSTCRGFPYNTAHSTQCPTRRSVGSRRHHCHCARRCGTETDAAAAAKDRQRCSSGSWREDFAREKAARPLVPAGAPASGHRGCARYMARRTPPMAVGPTSAVAVVDVQTCGSG